MLSCPGQIRKECNQIKRQCVQTRSNPIESKHLHVSILFFDVSQTSKQRSKVDVEEFDDLYIVDYSVHAVCTRLHALLA